MTKSEVAIAAIGLLHLVSIAASAQSIEEKAQVCVACHGENGVPQEKTTPIIWGQHAGYAYFQLRDFKTGTRKNEVMSAIVQTLEREDLLPLAEHFASKPWPRNEQPAASAAIAAQAARANTSLACTGCHLGAYQGDSTNPRLAGQNKEYMLQTMLDFRSGARGNNPGMTSLMGATSESDIAAFAEYLAGLQGTGQ
jgi:cytochrome c553